MVKRAIMVAAAVLLCCGAALSADKDDKEMKVGFVYVSPVGDAGYSYAHDMGRKFIDGKDGVTTAFVEAVAEGPDAERVILNMARKGYDLIFATSYGYMDPMLKVAQKFPDIVFMHCSGFKAAANMGNYFGRMYQARYLTGMVAGGMTRSNTLGYVAAFPIPEVIRGINAFTLGARAVNPDAVVRVVWTKTWYDPATEKEAAKSLLDTGADVIAQHQDSPGPQEAAQERGVYAIGYNTDMSAFAPKAHLTAAVWNWGPFYKEMTDAVRNGTWKSGAYWYGMDKGIVDISPMADVVPERVRARVAAVKAELIAGTFAPFSGELRDQSGVVRIPAGKSMTDAELLGMDWFVEGVVGSTQ
ncbi:MULTISPECIES: BMP family ABC transporter substrate-binding protein [Desulfococcus]|uniref:Basic membrane lipoprotein n=1 Tax=Desulfococcus multivorans DSM 2059 TaxID=1121405 RepID=S7UU76_DESML|nr:BMP family ABC transporter substrate-binding protein [Desulfococcus multivorans]AOY59900.1 putative ABC transport, predicted periplasmatic binding protein [Desulfococcus multivorans]EPR35898.1 basic membrane lipoprotein [Desulfococcus multivorans DSM 2059]SJZ34728.1 nucleoside-binding protein [Desulfococcus multivorans DSM 2059]